MFRCPISRRSVSPILVPWSWTVMVAAVWAPAADGRANPPGGNSRCLPDDLAVVWSNPAHGFVDVREGCNRTGEPSGITRFEILFNEAIQLTSDCIHVLTTADQAPSILDVSKQNGRWTIVLDRPIPVGASTALVFADGRAWIVVHSHPGDVDLDGTSDEKDVADLEAALDCGTADIERHDIDRNGSIDSDDVTRLLELLDGGHRGATWETEALAVRCCCLHGVCKLYLSQACPQGESPVDCPCVPNPCGGAVPDW